MKFSSLERRAAADHRRQEQVCAWRSNDRWLSFAAYLYWRNRLPVAAKLTTRAILLLEVYLLYRYFHTNVTAALSLILFCSLVFRGLFGGVMQAFRMVLAERRGHAERREVVYCFMLCALAGGAAAGLLLFGTAIYASASLLSVAFAAVWLVLLPLEFLSSAAWTSVYTMARLRRSFGLVLLLRLIPSAVLMVLHTPLWAYAYVAGLLAARLCENAYLYKTALRRLTALNLAPRKPRSLRAQIVRLFSQPSFRGHVLAPIPFQIYTLGLGGALYARSQHLWVANFVFFYLVMSFSYVSVRAAQSLEMDLFLLLRNGAMAFARRLRRRIEYASAAAAVLLIVGLNALFAGHAAFLTLQRGVLYEFWIYFIAALAVRTLFQVEMSINRAAGTERCYNTLLYCLLLGVMLPLQCAVIFYWRGNLPFVYLVDALGFLLISLPLLCTDKLSLSAAYNQAVERRLYRERLLAPALWVKYIAALRGQAVPFQVLLTQLDDRCRGQEMGVLRRVDEVCGGGGIFTQIVPGLFAYTLLNASPDQAREAARNVRFALGGHVRNAKAIDGRRSFKENIAEVLTALSRVRDPRRPNRTLLRTLRELFESGQLAEFEGRCRRKDFEDYSSADGAALIKELLKEHGFEALPVVFFDGRRTHSRGRVSAGLLQTAGRVFGQFDGQGSVLPARTWPYAVFAVCGSPAAVLDAGELDTDRKEKLYRLALCSALVISIKCAAQLCRVGGGSPGAL